jgi:hypothetical protein
MLKKLTVVICMLFILLLVQNGLAQEQYNTPKEEAITTGESVNLPYQTIYFESFGDVLFDNGPLVTLPGGGCAGGDASILDGSVGGHTLYGWNCNRAAGTGAYFYMADDFTSGTWDIDSMKFFAYQTGATTSTITGVYVQIWNGAPNAGGTVVWGDLTTNVLQRTALTNIYRALSTTPTNCDRWVQEVIATVDVNLLPGDYWVQFGCTGSAASGPWCPPVTISGVAVTGNALQLTATGWVPALNGTTSPNGAPFIIYGTDEIPVELTSFTASVIDGNVNLNWRTASEINNHGFEVQKAITGNDFVTIGFVTGNGTTTEAKNYNFVDKNITSGSYQYRLRQVDFDGRFEYSEVVEVDFESLPVEYTLSQNFPNPFNPNTKISFTLPVESGVTIKVFNVIGEEINNAVIGTFGAGIHNIEFNASNLNSGVYFYSLEATGTDGSNFSEVKKMMLTK